MVEPQSLKGANSALPASGGQEKPMELNKGQMPMQKEPQKPTQPQPPQPPVKRPFWKRIPGSIWGALVLLTLLITLLEGYPWLSVEIGERIEPNEPYTTLFQVVNEGYAPISHLDAECSFSIEASTEKLKDIQMSNIVQQAHDFAQFLTHARRATIPCNLLVLPGPKQIKAATFEITISYSFYPFTIQFLRRHQHFRFRGIPDSKGNIKWTFVS